MPPKNKKAAWISTVKTVVIWLFPFSALLMAGWIFYDYQKDRGPLIKIRFSDAASIEAGKTPLRFRGIKVGQVENIMLSEDGKEVNVFARLNKEAANMAVEGSQFWIVEPQVDFEGVRGLETLFKGPYIRVEKGKGNRKLEFQGLSGDDIDAAVSTVHYILRSQVVQSIGLGDPVTFRGLKIGNVSNVSLDASTHWVDVRINIERKHSRLIRTNTVFWIESAIDAKFGLFSGAKVKINSLESLLKGGIALATPNSAGPAAENGSRFPLQAETPKDWVSWRPVMK